MINNLLFLPRFLDTRPIKKMTMIQVNGFSNSKSTFSRRNMIGRFKLVVANIVYSFCALFSEFSFRGAKKLTIGILFLIFEISNYFCLSANRQATQ